MAFEGFKNGQNPLTDWHGPDSGRDTLLVVDDDPSVRDSLSMVLAHVLPEFTVREAVSAEMAVRNLRDGLSARTAKIFTDYRMGGMTGIDFTRALRGESSGIEIPHGIVMDLKRVPITIVSSEDLAEAGFLMRLGVLQGSVQKPFSVMDIANSVVTAVGNCRRHHSPRPQESRKP